MAEIIAAEDFKAAACNTSDLKPCPFCGRAPLSGGERNDVTGNIVYRVFCGHCTAVVSACHKPDAKPSDVRADAVAKWNKRARMDGEAFAPLPDKKA